MNRHLVAIFSLYYEHHACRGLDAAPSTSSSSDSGLGRHERTLLGQPAAAAIELQRSHFAGQHAGEGDESTSPDRGGVLKGQMLTGRHSLTDVSRLLQEAASAGRAPVWLPAGVLRRVPTCMFAVFHRNFPGSP